MKEKITAVLFLITLFLFPALHLICPDQELSITERRHLQQFPTFQLDAVFSGDWMTDFESYALDQFPGRDSFRSLRSNVMLSTFRLKDDHGIYKYRDHLVKMEYPFNKKSVDYFVKKLNMIQEEYFTDCPVYFAVIPDKNFYTSGEHLRMDYRSLSDFLRSQLSSMNRISLESSLSLDDYYKTDPHWKQENLLPVVSSLEKSMGFTTGSPTYKIHSYTGFHGAYTGQTAIPAKNETLCWMTSSDLSSCTVTNYETGMEEPVYFPEALNSMDPYNIFLSGPSALLSIHNDNANTDQRLLLFRDSFGSSLAPLLTNAYKEIILIDLRYISAEQAAKYVDFHNCDVLFLYSTLIINKSFSLK